MIQMTDDNTKYGDRIDDDHWEEVDEDDDTEETTHVSVRHTMRVNDERPEIDRYNGFVWWVIIEDGVVTAIEQSHYCPGPGHTDPMGFREWGDVPTEVRDAILESMNADSVTEVVDIERCAEAAETPDW